LFDVAYAMGIGPQGGGQGGQQGGMSFLFMIVPLVLIFYFLMFRPQKKKADEQKALLSSLKKGDLVLTQGGLYGRITGVADSFVTLEIAEKVRVKVSRAHISTKLKSEPKA